jgi:hypothetical protein
MKIATHVVLFGQDKWIMKNIENAYPNVDKIYVSYSEKPWAYNPKAKDLYTNTFDLNILRNSIFFNKIEIIEGYWNTEEDQRNACVDAANKDCMDYLIIHDADEFYSNSDFKMIIKHIENNPDYDYYKIAWYCFWKNFNYILLDVNGNKITGFPEFAINLKRGVRFSSKRRPNKILSYSIPPNVGICYHGSYVLSDEELQLKINTWGHTNDFNKEKWYNEKWLKWNENSVDLHLVSPSAWSKAVKFDGKLPEVIANMR